MASPKGVVRDHSYKYGFIIFNRFVVKISLGRELAVEYPYLCFYKARRSRRLLSLCCRLILLAIKKARDTATSRRVSPFHGVRWSDRIRAQMEERPRLLPSQNKTGGIPYDISFSKGCRKGRVPRDIVDRANRYVAARYLQFMPRRIEFIFRFFRFLIRSRAHPVASSSPNVWKEQ